MRIPALAISVLAAAVTPAVADDLPPAAMVETFIEYVYAASPRDQHGLEQIAWLLRHCDQPLCDRLEYQMHNRTTVGTRTAIVLSVQEVNPGQWEADLRFDTTNARKLPVIMLRATVLTGVNGKVTMFVSEPY